ncbi:MAG: peptidoglycan DD-metalloendopeptidase family protein [Flavobacteriales bacterium]|nr:peptidoglycan DD-metalloendopeptidase family protein [Flavobacteriales bacterium]
MSRTFNSLSLLLFCLLLSFGAIAQKRTDLEKKKSELSKDIEYKNKLLNETSKSRKRSLNELILIKKKIANRQNLILTLKDEIGLLEGQIATKQAEVQAKEKEITELKEEYAKMIYYAYKTRSRYDQLMFILASESVNQAYKRAKYLQQYATYRKIQGELILEAQRELNKVVAELEEKKIEKEVLLKAKEREALNLSTDQEDKQSVLNELSSKEKELKEEIKKKDEEARRLQKAIQKIIADELKKQQKDDKGKFVLTPEAMALSSNFANNKGKLPWPTAKGVITEYYGEHAHPVLKGIKVNNNGVDISTEENAIARSVFAGQVSAVFVIQGIGKAIMIRHGEYITVYSNLKEVYVQKGDMVETKQQLGLALTDPEKGKTEVHFEIWKGQTTMNPSGWLYQFK